MNLFKNFIKNYFTNFNRKLKSGQLAIDEFSLFLIFLSVLLIIVFMFLSLHQFAVATWIPLFIAYWRTLSKKKVKRYKENQMFIKYFYPANSFVKNTYRGVTVKKDHTYFNCKKCTQELRIPIKTGHIKVTCPKCNHSFVKKTFYGHFKKLKQKFSR